MRVPTYTRQTQPGSQRLVGPSGQGGTPEAFGAGVGRGVQVLAQGIGQLAAVVTQQDEQVRRFGALRKFSDFQQQTNNMLTEMSRAHDPTTGNFQDLAMSEYSKREQEFISQIDPEFQDEFVVRLGDLKTGLSSQALKFQIENNDAFFRQGLSDALNESKVALDQYNTPEEFDAQLVRMQTMLEASGLTPAEQQAELHRYQMELGKILYKGQQLDKLYNNDESASAIDTATEIIGAFNAATPEEEELLAKQGEQIAANAIGSLDLWARLPARARAALISLASDQGELPQAVVEAVQSGDLENISEAIRSLGGERRTQEADLVLNPGATIDDNPRFARVTYEDRLAIRADVQRAYDAQVTEATKAAKAANDSLVNDLMVGLFDGTKGQIDIDDAREAGVLTDITDIEKAYKLLDAKDSLTKMVSEGLAMLAAGQEFNPSNDDHRKILNAMVGEQGLKALYDKDSDYVRDQLIPIVDKGKDIPTDVVGTLRAMIRSNDYSEMTWALDTLAQLQQASPRAFGDRVDADTESAVQLWQTRKDFYTPEEVSRLVNGGKTQAERQQTEYLREEATKILRGPKAPVVKTELYKQFNTGGVFATGAPTPPGIQAQLEMDYDELFKDQYALYGDVEAASQAAIKLLSRNWGVTSVGGGDTMSELGGMLDNSWGVIGAGNKGRLMKFPPELAGYRPYSGSFDWMEKQLREEGILSPDADFQLVADETTASEVDAFKRGNGPPPSYLIIEMKDGVYKEVRGADGLPIRQFFDPAEEIMAEDAAWREEQNMVTMQDLTLRELRQAEGHSLETAIPIPLDVLDQINETFGFTQDNGGGF